MTSSDRHTDKILSGLEQAAQPMAASHVHAITSVGVDLGLDGYFCALTDNHEPIFTPMPVIQSGTKRSYNLPEICREISTMYSCGVKLIVIETQQAFPGMGSISSFSKGFCYGAFKGIMAALGVPFEELRPATWKKLLGIAGAGDAVKVASIRKASELFPGVDLRDHERSPRSRKPCHDKAEALLLCELAWRSVTGRRVLNG